jgi:hypothetical protein
MVIDAMAFCLGAILLLVGVVGGGLRIKEAQVPRVGKTIRLIAGGVGLFFIFGVALRVGTPRPAAELTPNESERLKRVNGMWSVTLGNGESRATFEIANGAGVFTTSYITEVEEELTSQYDARGLLLIGSTPMFRYSRTPLLGHNLVKILLEPRDDGNYRISLRNDGEWESIVVTKQNLLSSDLGALAGEWNLKFQGYDAFLAVNNGKGIYIWQTPVEITQLLRAKVTSEGIHFVGYDVVVKGTSTPPPFYAPDQFLFVRRPGSQYGYEIKAWDGEIMKGRRSLPILAYQPD